MPESKRKVYSVTELNRKARHALEGALGAVWVEGEISRMTVQSSGHWYFTLKDVGASVSCAMFMRENRQVRFQPKDGIQVKVLARPSLYEVNGRYQLIVSEMEEGGKGSLQEQFEKLKAKLKAEGLFDPAHKKKLPLLPRKIGIVTSPTGAAVRDIINVLTRRFPHLEILLVPAKVQGAGAEVGIAKAIEYLNKRGDIDLMIVGRGGGSIEDLWNFNEEIVARAIFESTVPVISAVGHEIDFTISDLVADVRAPTPSAAAELAVRQKSDWDDQFASMNRRLEHALKSLEQQFRLRLNRAAQSDLFREPKNLLTQYRLRITSLQDQLHHQLRFSLQHAQQRTDEASNKLFREPQNYLALRRQKLQAIETQLRMLSPLAVLNRGYSVTYKTDGTVVRSRSELSADDQITTRLADGTIRSKVVLDPEK